MKRYYCLIWAKQRIFKVPDTLQIFFSNFSKSFTISSQLATCQLWDCVSAQSQLCLISNSYKICVYLLRILKWETNRRCCCAKRKSLKSRRRPDVSIAKRAKSSRDDDARDLGLARINKLSTFSILANDFSVSTRLDRQSRVGLIIRFAPQFAILSAILIAFTFALSLTIITTNDLRCQPENCFLIKIN